MKFERHLNPNYILIKDVFDSVDVRMIYEEAMNLKDKFQPAQMGKGKDTSYRTNLFCDIDNLYKTREDSPLLKSLGSLLGTKQFTACLTTFTHPFYEFSLMNVLEHQLSSYSKNQFYKWHFDKALGNRQRMLTLVYFFHKLPRVFQGGSFQLLDCPIVDREPIEPDLEPITIEPENNTAIVFSSHQVHRVMPILNEVSFEESRFSVNMWMGIDSKMELLKTIRS